MSTAKLISLFFLAVLTSSFPFNVSAQSNPSTKLIDDINHFSVPKGLSIPEHQSYLAKKPEMIKALARMTVNYYEKSQLDVAASQIEFNKLSEYDYNLLTSNFATMFYDDTCAKLKATGGRKAKLISFAKQEQFKFIIHSKHYQIDHEATDKAFYHDGLGTVSMNYTLIPSQEWPIIFIHEVTHAIDEELESASTYLSSVKQSQVVFDLINKPSSYRPTVAEEKLLDDWFFQELNRKFFAEVRAWAVTFSLYTEGLRDHSFQRLRWLDTIISQKKVKESWMEFSLRYFDPRFTDPTEGSFSTPIALKFIARGREKVRKDIKLFPIGKRLTELTSK
ncbi:MAG: hypothetical protein QE271_00410 [Bacteriovoracaceae bacterium]|nr:hypothetical protein [Bacteriovoracaceae bacterium]